MLWTTTPALVISLILYTVLGFTSASGGAVDTTTADLYIDNLSAHFNLSPVCLIPVVVLIVVIVKKAPAIPGLVVSALLGAVMAVIFQGSNPIDVANLMYDGFTIDTGVEQIDSPAEQRRNFQHAVDSSPLLHGLHPGQHSPTLRAF